MVLPINAIHAERLAGWKSSKMHHGAVAVCNVAENNYVNVGAHGAFVGRNKIYVMRTTNGHDWTRMPRRRADDFKKILFVHNGICMLNSQRLRRLGGCNCFAWRFLYKKQEKTINL